MAQRNCPEEERLSPIAVLLWIATRSQNFMRALEGLPHISLEAQLCQLQRENHSPHRMTLANALTAFRQELERGSLRAFERPGSPASDGALLMSNIDALGLMDIAFRAADVVRIWPEWPVTRAWNAAKERLWQPQQGIPKGTLKTLPAADYLPFAEVARMLAFGRGKTALGLSDIEEEAALLRAGLALIKAAAGGAVRFIGMPCERLPAAPHLLRQMGSRIPIGPEVLADLGPVPFGGRDWLGPRHFAEGYAECGHAPQSVRFCEAAIERTSLVRWLSALSTKAPG
jgi:hypothetical protein